MKTKFSKLSYNLLFLVLAMLFLCASICFYVDAQIFSANGEIEIGEITAEEATGNLLDDNGYVNYYKIPTSYISEYTAGGGETSSNPLSNAFDGNWNTYWQTSKDNSNNPVFYNDITVTFKENVTIDRILYASSSARHGHGYPTTLNIYTAQDGEFMLYDTITSSATNSRMVFTFSSPQTVKKIKFEFVVCNQEHNWIATAKELQFLMPENSDIETIRNSGIFANYSQTELKDEFNSADKIEQMRNSVKSYACYESQLKSVFDRAEAIVAGTVKFDARREYSTADDAYNKIEQYGNMRSYASSVLRLSSYGINRQVTGIAGVTGSEIVIYVEADEGAKLPSIAFTQTYGAWQSWKKEVSLSRGKNVFTFPNLKTSAYSVAVSAGGPIHIINPYTPEEQNGNVKLYIEGGSFYPVFKDGDDENTFLLYLKDYYEKLNDTNNNEVQLDAFEAVTDHVILSATATLAYNAYVVNGASPQANCDRWNAFLIDLLQFGGVGLNEGDEGYDARNAHIYTNIRAVQPWPGAYAYAASDMIGLIDSGTFGQLVNRSTTGWAIGHELGHSFDNTLRTWGEVTNNMWAYYNVMGHGLYDRLPLKQVVNYLASDITLTNSAFQSFDDNCVIWMVIEGAFPGYWGKLENRYRYENTGTSLGRTEKMVYYSSLAAGIDLSYYFERWGFYMTQDTAYSASNRFTYEKSSSDFKQLMAEALSSSRISSDEKEIWYIDTNQFKYLLANDYTLGDWSSCYSTSDTVNILEIAKSGDNYSLFLPEPKNSVAHLGYEISAYIDGKWQVVGFTYSTSFTDTNTYKTAPKYRVRAFDRQFNATGFTEQSYTEVSQSGVCKLNNAYYNSIAEAVKLAKEGDTIYLLKDIKESGIVVDKSLTFAVEQDASADVIVCRYGAGNMITINSGAVLTVTGQENAKIIFDGNSSTQAGSIIYVNGELVVTGNVVFRNNINSGNGGAIFANGVVRLTNAEVSNNKASIGGAIYCNNVRTYFNNVKFNGNTSTGNGGVMYNVGTTEISSCQYTNNVSGYCGGAICNNDGGVVTITSSTFEGNKAVSGGAIYANGYSTLKNLNITNNTATNGGAIYSAGANGARKVYVYGGTLTGNTATNGSLFYLSVGEFYVCKADIEPIAMPTMSGEIYKSTSANMTVNNEMFDATNIRFVLQSVVDGARLFAFDNFDVTEDQISNVSVYKATAYLDARVVKVSPALVNVTIVSNGKEYKQQISVGNYTFAGTVEGLGEDKYISSWTYNGKSYATGETIEVAQDCTFYTVLGNKIAVTLTDAKASTVVYIVPDTDYYLPLNSPSGIEVCAWYQSGTKIIPATKVHLTTDTTFVADTFATYEVVFKNYDGKIISSTNYYYGNNVKIPDTPTKEPTINYVYTFSGWSTEVATTCKSDAEYTATYVESDRIYEIVFKDYDGTVISTNNYKYGETIFVPDNPTRNPDMTCVYAFSEWLTEDDQTLNTICTDDLVYIAGYSIVYINYVVTFKDYDGKVLSSTTYHYGDALVVPENMTREADDIYKYEFKEWASNFVSTCTGNAVYTATYSRSYKNPVTIMVEKGKFKNSNDNSMVFNKGMKATIVVDKPSVWLRFVGWYKDDELVSSKETYTFVANEDMTFVGVYDTNVALIVLVSVESVLFVLAVVCIILIIKNEKEKREEKRAGETIRQTTTHAMPKTTNQTQTSVSKEAPKTATSNSTKTMSKTTQKSSIKATTPKKSVTSATTKNVTKKTAKTTGNKTKKK